MGLSCKSWGKYESTFKKLDNKLKAEKEAFKHKLDTKKEKKPKVDDK